MAGTGGGSTHTGSRRSGGALGTWSAVILGYCGANGEQWDGVSTIGGVTSAPLDFPIAGNLVLWVLVAPGGTGGSQQQYLQNECVDPPPTAPPDVEALLAMADLPRPPVVTNPPAGGLVGLENWFWYEGATAVPVAVTVDGWTATSTARTARYTWTFDGTSVSSDGPGSSSAPAARHTFTTGGQHPITLTIRWEAVFTLSGFGLTFTAPLGGIDLAGPALAYPVQEREAVVVG